MHSSTILHDGVSLPVEYEFDKGCPETWINPADASFVTLHRIQLNDVWVDPDNWIFPEIVDKWCEQLLEQHE